MLIGAFLIIGMLVTWLIYRQQIAMRRSEKVQKELADSLRQLRLSEARYRALFENASEAIFICSRSGRIISANRACEELTGRTEEELTAATVHELISGIRPEVMEGLFSGQVEKITIGEAEKSSLMRKDGTRAHVELKINPLFRDHEVVGLQAIARDVTQEMQRRQNMQYYLTQIIRAQEDERLRISRELHDDTAQVLAGLSRSLASLDLGKGKPSGAVAERLKKLREMADSALEGVRRFSQDLRPSILDDLGLVPALEWLLADLEKRFGLGTKVEVAGEARRLSAEKELMVFRIVQEALSNVKRHAAASTVVMTLDFAEDALTLTIADNGRGFVMPLRTSDLALAGKLGMIGMRERARLVGGTLIVQSEVGKGTTVTLRMPL